MGLIFSDYKCETKKIRMLRSSFLTYMKVNLEDFLSFLNDMKVNF